VIIDFDDFWQNNHRLDLLERLHGANSSFRCTLFAIPGLGGPDGSFWSSVPDWCELAVHGWFHGEPATECLSWDYWRMRDVIEWRPERFVRGFKAPGWQISDECYTALLDCGWWVADQPYNDARRPRGLRVHRLGDGEHWHGHIQNVCGNGIEERFDELLALVESTDQFSFVSETVHEWRPALAGVS